MICREQIAADNYHYRYHPFSLFVENQKKAGISSVEIWGGSPHFYMDDTVAEGFTEAREQLDRAGLSVAAFAPESESCLYSLCAWNDVVWAKAGNYYHLAVDAASVLGAPILVLSCCGGAKDQPWQNAYNHAVEQIKALAPYAREKGITLAIRTGTAEEGSTLQTLRELQSLLKDVGEPNVGGCLDLCAMNTAYESIDDWFAALGQKLVHIHFADGTPGGRLVWGEGLCPLDDAIAALNAWGYTGALGLLLTRESYFFAPERADKRNQAALSPYIREERRETV